MDYHKKIERPCDQCGRLYFARCDRLAKGRALHCSNSCSLKVRGRNDPRKKTAVARAVKRFWVRVDKTPGCWIWISAKDGDGYAHFMLNSTRIKAHRFSYELAYGPIPAGLLVCHHCDNPLCVRPDHLFVGTHSDNHRDMHAKGRGHDHRGEKCPTAKLTDAKVLEMRRLHRDEGIGYRRLARRFHVGLSTARAVLRGMSWRHLDTAPPLAE